MFASVIATIASAEPSKDSVTSNGIEISEFFSYKQLTGEELPEGLDLTRREVDI